MDDVRLGVVTSMKMHTMDVSKFQSTFFGGVEIIVPLGREQNKKKKWAVGSEFKTASSTCKFIFFYFFYCCRERLINFIYSSKYDAWMTASRQALNPCRHPLAIEKNSFILFIFVFLIPILFFFFFFFFLNGFSSYPTDTKVWSNSIWQNTHFQL